MLTSGSSVPCHLFGGDVGNGNNFKIVKWSTSLERVVHILFDCIEMDFMGRLGTELCEDISTLPCVRSVPIILFGGNDNDVNYFKLITYYCF